MAFSKVHTIPPILKMINAVVFGVFILVLTSGYIKDDLPNFTHLENAYALENEEIDPLSFGHKYKPNQILIKYKSDMVNLGSPTGVLASSIIEASHALEGFDYLDQNNIVVADILDGESIYQKIVELSSDPSVEYAQANFVYKPTVVPNDTDFSKLWGIHNTHQYVGGSYPAHVTNNPAQDVDIDGVEAWDLAGVPANPVLVAVIDDGVAYNHPDLLPNMWNGSNCKSENGSSLGGCVHGYNFAENNKMPLPTSSSHGTHIAGTIAAVKNNSTGVVGVAPHAKLMAIRMDGTTAQVIKAIEFAKQNGAEVINFSWTYDGVELGSYFDKALYNTMKAFPGVIVVAAGNGDANGIGFNLDDGNPAHRSYPSGFRTSTPFGAGLSNLIVAVALDQNDLLASFSNFGSQTTDIGAPGTNIYSTGAESLILSENFDLIIPTTWKTSSQSKWAVVNGVLWADTAIPYIANANTNISTAKINLGGNPSSAVLSFVTACDTEYSPVLGGDYMALEYSSDGIQFNEIMKWNEYILDSINGDSNSAGAALYKFSSLPIGSQYFSNNFTLRFRWVTNSSDNSYEGCYVDSIKLNKISDGSDAAYTYLSGTSMAAPMTTGIVALLKGYASNLTTEQLRENVVTSGDEVKAIKVKTIHGRRVNAYNSLLAVSSSRINYNNSTYYESSSNDGSVSNSLDLSLSGDSFAQNITLGQNIIISNIPIGLTPEVERLSNSLVKISLSGKAMVHESSNDIPNISIVLSDSAFVGGNAGAIANSSRNDISLKFYDESVINPGSGGNTVRGLPQVFER